MNIYMPHIANYGPVAWNSGNGLQSITVKIHTTDPKPQRSGVHINPDVRAMAEARGEFHQRNR